jgi:hypothetical protein
VASTGISTGTLTASGASALQAVTLTSASAATLVASTGISTGTLTASGASALQAVTLTSASAATLVASTGISTGSITASGPSTLQNVTLTNASAATLVASTGISTGTLTASGASALQAVTLTSASAATLVASTGISTGTFKASGTSALQAVTLTNASAATLVASTGISTGTLTATGISTLANVDAVDATFNYVNVGWAGGGMITPLVVTNDNVNYGSAQAIGIGQGNQWTRLKSTNINGTTNYFNIELTAQNSTYTSALAITNNSNTIYVDLNAATGIYGTLSVSSGSNSITIPSGGQAVKHYVANTSGSVFSEWTQGAEAVRGIIGLDGIGYSGGVPGFLMSTWSNHPIYFATNATKRMVINTSGNVGIGTTSPSEVLSINGNIRLGPTTDSNADYSIKSAGQLTIAANDAATQDATYTYLTISSGPTSTRSVIDMIGSSTEKFIKLSTSNTERMRIDASGNVGLGISSPAQILHIQKSGSDNYIKVDAGGTNSNYSGIMFSEYNINYGWTLRHSAVSDNLYISYQDNTPTFTDLITFDRINNRMGINQSSPSYNLHIGSGSGTIGFDTGSIGSLRFTGTGSTTFYPGHTLAMDSNNVVGGSFIVQSNMAQGSTKVGINNQSPSYTLDVAGRTGLNSGASTDGNVILTNTIGGGVIQFNDIHHSIWGRRGYDGVIDKMQFREYGQIEFWTGGIIGSQSNRMTILNTGNVGIGITTPNSKLHVNGSITSVTQGYALLFGGDAGSAISGVGTNYRDINIASYGGNGITIAQNNGYLGVGTSSPSYPLHVVGTGYGGFGITYYAWGPYTGIAGAAGNVYSIYASARIAASEFNAYSDTRMKKNIVDIDDTSALAILRQLEPKRYNYIDEVKRGSTPVWGFIAQQVGQVLDYATKTITDFIPNIYELANVGNDNHTVVLQNKTTTDLAVEMKIKIITIDDKPIETNITDIIDSKTFTVQCDLSEIKHENKVFVYGIEVEDFHTLNKDAIFTIATAALQEVDRELQATKTDLETEKAKTNALETRILQLEQRLSAAGL